VYQSLLDLIGNTPLLTLSRISPNPDVKVLAKAEWFNPGGSIKDRPILNIVNDGESKGILKKGKTILDASSGNAGISYAMIGAAKGYPVKLCVPGNISLAGRRVLQILGADVVFTEPVKGSDGAILKARELQAASPDKYFYGDQYSNDANWKAHYLTTGPEILQQTEGRVTHFVAGVGTSGTLRGVGRRLKERNPKVKLVEVQPSSPLHGIDGLKHMDSSIVPRIYDPSLADERIGVETEDAQKMVRRMAREYGILVGTSSGANLFGALEVAAKIKEGTVVTVLPDSATRYLFDSYWAEFIGPER
jgi:S-sulfo-L-cysteine synthase (O-acetyl-L-serine-dependent)